MQDMNMNMAFINFTPKQELKVKNYRKILIKTYMVIKYFLGNFSWLTNGLTKQINHNHVKKSKFTLIKFYQMYYY